MHHKNTHCNVFSTKQLQFIFIFIFIVIYSNHHQIRRNIMHVVHYQSYHYYFLLSPPNSLHFALLWLWILLFNKSISFIIHCKEPRPHAPEKPKVDHSLAQLDSTPFYSHMKIWHTFPLIQRPWSCKGSTMPLTPISKFLNFFKKSSKICKKFKP